MTEDNLRLKASQTISRDVDVISHHCLSRVPIVPHRRGPLVEPALVQRHGQRDAVEHGGHEAVVGALLVGTLNVVVEGVRVGGVLGARLVLGQGQVLNEGDAPGMVFCSFSMD